MVEELTVRGCIEMPCGYDEHFVSPIDEDLQCSICCLALREPVLTRCGHRFCRECLDRHLARQKTQQQVCNCPVDREGLMHHKDIFPDKATGRKILSLLIRCPSTGCDWTGELRSKENHFDHCKRKPVKCPNDCGSFIARREIESHVDNECLLTVISCPYALMGCKEKTQRNKVEDHLRSTTRLHLALTCKTFQEMTDKLDALQKQVVELKASNSSVTAKVDALDSKVDAQNKKLASMDSALHADRREWKAVNTLLNSKVDSQAQEISRLTNESPFVWKITGFSDVLKQAKNRSTTSIFSEFYTGKQGYRLKVRVDPDGDQTNKNRYLSLYVGLMKGNYDAILPWPFRQKVTFKVIDQQPDPAERKDIVAALEPDQSTSFSGRPTTEEKSELRVLHRFISHKVLKTRRYVENDTLFLQVEVGPRDYESRDSNSDSDSD